MIDSLYQQYVFERQGLLTIWEEHGFIAYRVTSEECFLADMFIRRDARQSGKGRELLGRLEDVARARDCKVISANIFLKDPNCNKTLAAAMACGFKVTGSAQDVLLIVKKLKLKEEF